MHAAVRLLPTMSRTPITLAKVCPPVYRVRAGDTKQAEATGRRKTTQTAMQCTILEMSWRTFIEDTIVVPDEPHNGGSILGGHVYGTDAARNRRVSHSMAEGGRGRGPLQSQQMRPIG
eukprot:EG_transcript_43630